jgi:hypothetical protein
MNVTARTSPLTAVQNHSEPGPMNHPVSVNELHYHPPAAATMGGTIGTLQSAGRVARPMRSALGIVQRMLTWDALTSEARDRLDAAAAAAILLLPETERDAWRDALRDWDWFTLGNFTRDADGWIEIAVLGLTTLRLRDPDAEPRRGGADRRR